MLKLTHNQILYGSNETLPEQVSLRAGPLVTFFEEGTLRHVKLGNTIILHQIYAALRDHNWNTIPGKLTNLSIDVRDDSFDISFNSRHKQGPVDFVWTGTIIGDSSGTITFHFDGQANSTFDRNRIGFCVLHPTNCAGQACFVEHVDGSETSSTFPEFISPHQPFFNIRAIRHQVDGAEVRVLMEGDTFEMEDQRNWTDASYKTYCTPLGIPFPVTLSQGDRIQQTITLSLKGNTISSDAATSPLEIHMRDKTLGTIRPIGLNISNTVSDLSDLQVKRLSALHLAHLRVDINLQDASWPSGLQTASRQASQLNCQLEVAVHLTDDAENQLRALSQFAESHSLAVVRWIIFHVGEKSTSARWVELARQYLLTAPVGAGTNAFFTELNRRRPPVDAIDFAIYSTNPQVHAFDNLSLMETLAIQSENVNSARQFCDNKPIVVSPITLKKRSNPNKTGDSPSIPEGELPPNVDVRQMSLLGACWTLGSLKYNIESQVESLTYFETVGWLGLMDAPQASKLANKFPSIPDAVFPMYHVFMDIGELADTQVVTSETTHPLHVDTLMLKQSDKIIILLANMSPNPQTAQLNIPHGQYTIRRLNRDNAIEAMTNPEIYRSRNIQTLHITTTSSLMTLSPYEYVRLQQK